MKRKQRYIARLDEVTITREGEYAVIAYKEEGVPTTHLGIGPEIADMTDQSVTCIRATHGCEALPRGGIKNDDNVHGTPCDRKASPGGPQDPPVVFAGMTSLQAARRVGLSDWHVVQTPRRRGHFEWLIDAYGVNFAAGPLHTAIGY